MIGGPPYHIFVLQGQSRKVPLNITMDSGSSHNFLDPKAAKQVGCKLTSTTKNDGHHIRWQPN